MNRPAFAILALAGLVVAFELSAPPARATASSFSIARGASPTPSPSPSPSDSSAPDATPSPSPAPGSSGAPSPTVVVPLVDLSVSNGAASPSPSPSPSGATAAPSDQASPTSTPAPRGRRNSARPTATPTEAPTDTPPPTEAPTAPPSPESTRGRNVRSNPTPTPAPPPPTQAPTASPTDDITSTSIPTQPPTPRPVAPLQPSIPQSLDDPNVQSILSRPGSQLGPFNWLTGQWSAHTYESHTDGSRKDLGPDTYVFAATMKNRWMFGGDGRGTDYFYISYDPFARQWAIVRFNGNPSYGIWLSKSGWQGNRITFDSTYSWVNGRQYRRRVTISHYAAKRFSMTDEEQLPNGAWLTDSSVEFTKQ